MNAVIENDCLIRTLRHGVDGLPTNLRQLRDYIRLLEMHLAEWAEVTERDVSSILYSSSGTEMLLELESRALERAAALPATTLEEVQIKLGLWADLSGDGEGAGDAASVELVQSIRRDIDSLIERGDFINRGVTC